MISKKKILIIGSEGFIGRACVKKFLESDIYEVYGTDLRNHPTLNYQYLKSFPHDSGHKELINKINEILLKICCDYTLLNLKNVGIDKIYSLDQDLYYYNIKYAIHTCSSAFNMSKILWMTYPIIFLDFHFLQILNLIETNEVMMMMDAPTIKGICL